MDHPNLSAEFDRAIQSSEREGGVWLRDIPPFHELRVQTRNTLYELKTSSKGGWLIRGNVKWCPDWSQASVHGSTFGGSMIKLGFVGRGMNMEFSLAGEAKLGQEPPWTSFTTSKITDIWEVDEEGRCQIV